MKQLFLRIMQANYLKIFNKELDKLKVILYNIIDQKTILVECYHKGLLDARRKKDNYNKSCPTNFF